MADVAAVRAPAYPAPRWAVVWSLVLSLAGVGVAGYLTIAHYTANAVLLCSRNKLINCEAVTTSSASHILGIPVALLGLLFFLSMVVLNLPAMWRRPSPRVLGRQLPPARVIRRVRLLWSLAGICFVLWLIYAELFIARAICLWCTATHVIAFALFLVILAATQEATAAPRGAAPVRRRPAGRAAR